MLIRSLLLHCLLPNKLTTPCPTLPCASAPPQTYRTPTRRRACARTDPTAGWTSRPPCIDTPHRTCRQRHSTYTQDSFYSTTKPSAQHNHQSQPATSDLHKKPQYASFIFSDVLEPVLLPKPTPLPFKPLAVTTTSPVAPASCRLALLPLLEVEVAPGPNDVRLVACDFLPTTPAFNPRPQPPPRKRPPQVNLLSCPQEPLARLVGVFSCPSVGNS